MRVGLALDVAEVADVDADVVADDDADDDDDVDDACDDETDVVDDAAIAVGDVGMAMAGTATPVAVSVVGARFETTGLVAATASVSLGGTERDIDDSSS